MTMDLMQLEAFLDFRGDRATEMENRHLSEKARHEDEAERNKEVAVFCHRAAARVRGLRKYLLQAPSGLAIEIIATIKAGAEESEASEAGAKADVPSAADPVPELASVETDAPETAAPPKATVTPEAAGITEDDQRILDVMRMNRDRWGVCGITVTAAAEIAGVSNAKIGIGMLRLKRARRVIALPGRKYRVSDKGGSFPVLQEESEKPEPSPMAERMVPRPVAPILPANPKSVASLADRLLAKFAEVSAKTKNDTVMFGRDFLIDLAGAQKGDFLHVDHALAELGSRRAIEVTHRDKTNVTVRLIKAAEAAE